MLGCSLVAPVVNFRYSSAAVTRRSLAVAAPSAPAPSARLHSSGWKYFRPPGLCNTRPGLHLVLASLRRPTCGPGDHSVGLATRVVASSPRPASSSLSFVKP